MAANAVWLCRSLTGLYLLALVDLLPPEVLPAFIRTWIINSA
jgi:hypothetical protein